MDDTNWLSQQLHLLLTAYGYNLYNSANRARADDLLVRERASTFLGDAVSHLTRLATDYSAQYIPPSTREQPFPPADRLAALKQMQSLRDDVSVLAARIRGLSVPTQDRTWARFRQEASMLQFLLSSDYTLITQAEALSKSVGEITPDAWSADTAQKVREQLHALEQAGRDRERFLNSV